MRRFSTLIILSLVVAFLAMSAFGASSYTPANRVDNSLAKKAVHYSMPYPDESNITRSSSGKASDQPLGLVNPPSSQSPGMVIGYTWYDYQSNGTVGRNIDWGWDAASGYMVHFTWMYLPTRIIGTDRAYAYAAYYSSTGEVPTFAPIQGTGDYAGYVELDAMDLTSGGRHGAAVSGHNNPGGGYAPETYYETDYPGVGFFSSSRVTDSVQCYQAQSGNDYCAIWPTMRYQEVSGHTPVTHVFAQTSMPAAGDPQAILYFRKVGMAQAGTWDYPPYVVDTVFDIAQDIACSNTTGRIALAWVANLVETNLAACDTCSDNEGDSAIVNSQWENDLYYQVNTNYGAAGSWLPRVNLTKNLRDEAGYRPYTDLSILMGSNDDVHIAWSASIWEGRATGIKDVWACRLFAWSENNGYTTGGDGFQRANMRTVADLNYPAEDYPDCGSGSWNMLGCKMSISECNNRLYYMWVQYNDVANGVTDDCAQRAYAASDILGSANGELFLSVSTTLEGCVWDAPRNLTNSRTNGCDSLLGTGGRCDNDNWPSMARHGSNHTGAEVVDSIIVDPSGSYSGGYYLPVSYIADQDAGGIVQDEGTWQQADVVWFQLACVTPIDTKTLIPSLTSVGFPAWCKPGASLDTGLVVENTGNQTTTFTAATTVTSGHPAGALTISPTGGSITAGCTSAPLPMTIYLANGLITPAAGTAQKLTGTITFSGDFVGAPRVLPISFIVADTVIFEKWDTVYCVDGGNALALSVGNNGNFGHQGGSTGKVNLDYWVSGREDCVWDEQTETNPYLGNTRIYLYDGSPIICKDNGGEIDCNYSMFDYTFAGGGPNDGFYDGGFFPRADAVQAYPVWMTPQGTPDCQFTVYEFVNRDTSILIEQVTIAPNVTDPQYMVQATKFTNLTASAITGLAIGEGIDWDIPTDSGSWNGAGYDASLNLMYQVGEEYSQDTVPCGHANERFGGLAVLNIYEDGGTTPSSAQHGMYAMDNATQVYPLGHFSPDSLFNFMNNKTGFTLADSAQYNDLHTVTTFRANHTLAASGGNLIVYTLLATQETGTSSAFATTVAEGKQWYVDNFMFVPPTCCVYVGDIDHNGGGGGAPDIGDLIYLVTFMFQAGPCAAMCNDGTGCAGDAIFPEADLNGDGTVTPDIGDLIYMVTFMFQNGPEPPQWIDATHPACNPL